MIFPSLWMSFPHPSWEEGGAGAETGAVIDVPGGGCDIILIYWTGVNTIWGFEGGVGGSRYHTRIPKVKPRKLRVVMTGLITISEGGKRKGIM